MSFPRAPQRVARCTGAHEKETRRALESRDLRVHTRTKPRRMRASEHFTAHHGTGRPLVKRRSLSLALAGAAALALVLAVVSTSPASTAHADDKKVPIIGTFTYTGSANNKLGSVVGALHSVVRIPGGTAVFYSVGGEGATPLSLMGSSDFSLPYTGHDAREVKIGSSHSRM